MHKLYLWQEPDFPSFYCNPTVIAPFEIELKHRVQELQQQAQAGEANFNDVLTEEIVANSEIEGIALDRASVNSSFVNNISPVQEKEQGAVALTKMALEHCNKPLSHEMLKAMHGEILKGSQFPESSIGRYVGDMKIVSGNRLDVEYQIIHEGVSKDLVDEKMTEFIEWYNSCSDASPVLNAIQGHIHFETLHPFCDGNGRIGRSLMLMGLCRDFKSQTPLALSRAFNAKLNSYYRQFETGLDLTDTIKSIAPLLLDAVEETQRILELTMFRTKVSDVAKKVNARQLKVLNRLIDYELKDRFKGGMNNTKYQKMTGIGDRTALRDLNELEELGFMLKLGKLKGTRYYLNIPSVLKEAD